MCAACTRCCVKRTVVGVTWRSAGSSWSQVKRHVDRLQMDSLGCSGACCQVWLPGFRKTVEGGRKLPEIKEMWDRMEPGRENWSETTGGLKSIRLYFFSLLKTHTGSDCSHHYNFPECWCGLWRGPQNFLSASASPKKSATSNYCTLQRVIGLIWFSLGGMAFRKLQGHLIDCIIKHVSWVFVCQGGARLKSLTER